MAHTPLQKRVLLGLESGRKLQNVLQEPNMPTKAMVEEWRENPEFDAAFTTASATGKAWREAKTGIPEAPATPGQSVRSSLSPTPRPLPFVPLDEEPSDTAPMEPVAEPEPEPVPTAQAPAAPRKRGRTALYTDDEMVAECEKLLHEGTPISRLFGKVRGLNAKRLNTLCKTPAFKTRLDAARKRGLTNPVVAEDKLPAPSPAPAPAVAEDVADIRVGNMTEGRPCPPVVPGPAAAAIPDEAERKSSTTAGRRFLVVQERPDYLFGDLNDAIGRAREHAAENGYAMQVVEVVCTARPRTVVDLVDY